MKIALELQPLLKNRTGVGWYTYEIVKSLTQHHPNIDYSGFYFNFLNREELPKELKGINSKVCKLMPYGVYQRMWNYVPLSYRSIFGSNADIYHFFNFLVPPGVKGKAVVTIYDMVFKRFPETMTAKNLRRLENNLTASAKRADAIITISENSKKEIIQYLNVDPSKIHIVAPGVDLKKYSKVSSLEQKEVIRKKYSLPEQYVLYLGTLEPRKNVESIIEAFALFRKNNNSDIKLVIAGKKGWNFDTIFERVKAHGIETEVIFTGYVEEEDKPTIYSLAEIFIFPSLYEGFGMPVIEAMASGVPVITSNNSSLPEAAGDAAILCDPLDYRKMSREIQNILADNKLKNDMISKGLKQSSKFTWENSIDELIKVYKKLQEV